MSEYSASNAAPTAPGSSSVEKLRRSITSALAIRTLRMRVQPPAAIAAR